MIPLCHCPIEPGEYRLVTSQLLAAGVRYRETDANFLTPSTLWVEEIEFDKASSVVRRCFAEYSAAHSASRRGATKVFRRKHPPWQVWRSSTIAVVLTLVMMVGAFAVYPLLVAFGVFR